MANGQNIDYSKKENGPRASSAPALRLNTIIFKYVYWYMKQISGEHLQDHWSSGILSVQYPERGGCTLICQKMFKTLSCLHIHIEQTDFSVDEWFSFAWLNLKSSMYKINIFFAQLEGISTKQRTAKINMALAKLYLRSGMDRSAITSYKEVLR